MIPLTHRQYTRRWQNNWYRGMVRAQAFALGGDGCSGVPDFYVDGCHEHDIAYRTHRDPLGKPIDKKEADKRLRWFIQDHSIFGRFSPMSWWRWWFLDTFIKRAWHEGKDLGHP